MDFAKTEKRRYYATSQSMCAIIIDCRSSIIVQQQDRINQWLHDFFKEAQRLLKKEHHRVDACIITVADTVELVTPFTDGDLFTELNLHCESGASMDDAVNMALDLLEERKAAAKKFSLYCNKYKLFVLSADIVNYCVSLADPDNRLHRMIENESVNFYPVVYLPPFITTACCNNLQDAHLPTLESPLKKVLHTSDDYEEIFYLDDDDSELGPPTPSCITISI